MFFFFTFAVIILFHLPCLSDSSLAQNHSPMFSGVSPSVSFKALRYKCSLTSLNFVFFYNLCNICDLAINACSWCIYLHKKFSVDWIWGDAANCWNNGLPLKKWFAALQLTFVIKLVFTVFCITYTRYFKGLAHGDKCSLTMRVLQTCILKFSHMQRNFVCSTCTSIWQVNVQHQRRYVYHTSLIGLKSGYV